MTNIFHFRYPALLKICTISALKNANTLCKIYKQKHSAHKGLIHGKALGWQNGQIACTCMWNKTFGQELHILCWEKNIQNGLRVTKSILECVHRRCIRWSWVNVLTFNRACPPWWPLLVLLNGYLISLSSHSNSVEDRVPVDFIYGYMIFNWVALTWPG